MKRRTFILALGGAAAAWPLAARAQQPMPVIGFLRSTTASGFEHLETALRHGLDEEGFVEGRNVVIEYRYADNQRDRLPALVDDLIRRSVAVIVGNHNAALAAGRERDRGELSRHRARAEAIGLAASTRAQ